MFEINPQIQVSDIAVEAPQTIRVFEQLGIDYCCGGRLPLSDACAKRGLSTEDVISQLEFAMNDDKNIQAHQWDRAPLHLLCFHIVQRHHRFARTELERLLRLMSRVNERHALRHPHLAAVEELFIELDAELRAHMAKEEQILFPYIDALEQSQNQQSSPPHTHLGELSGPMRVMMSEHDEAGGTLRRIRALCNEFIAPDDACPTLLGLYQGMADFERDLHMHIHLENNILFPRTLELERQTLHDHAAA